MLKIYVENWPIRQKQERVIIAPNKKNGLIELESTNDNTYYHESDISLYNRNIFLQKKLNVALITTFIVFN